MIQATDKESIRSSLQRFGAAPGAQYLLQMELEAAQQSISTGHYTTWRPPTSLQDCTRIGPSSRCFCDHSFADHRVLQRTSPCNSCPCQHFKFIPSRPEEVGEWWLPRRKDFDIRTYKAKCKCGHSHVQHHVNRLTCQICKFKCYRFESAFCCVVCDRAWEDHETIFENEKERRESGRTVGKEFLPLAGDRDIQRMVFEEPQENRFARTRKKK